MPSVLITRRIGIVRRVPLGREPVVEFKLEDNQRVVGITMSTPMFDGPGRKTQDWHYTAYIETRV